MIHFKNKITGFTRLALVLLAGFVLVSCGGGGGSQPSGGTITPPGGTNTGLVVIASGTVDPLGGTINDTLGETAVIALPGSLSGNATITIERGRDASGHVVTRILSSSPTAIPVDIVLPPADVVENSTPSSGTPLVAGVITFPFIEGDTDFPCPDKNSGVDAGGVDTHWFRRCSHFWKSTSNPLGIGNRIESEDVAMEILGGVKITHRPASVLSSKCNFSNASCYVDHQPVLFVHGFSPSDTSDIPIIGTVSDNGFGGGVKTWGEFPDAMQQSGYVPFEFRWVTAAKLQDVAADLGRAIDQIAKRTGKKVHVIAHSFGGVLVRTYLQGQSSGGYPYNNNVATLTTVGTPHSGIFDGDPKYNVLNSITYERGQDTQGTSFWAPLAAGGDGGANINKCQQLSCYQLGEFVNLAGWGDSFNFSLAFSQQSAAAVYGVATYPGEMAAKLFETRHQLPNVPIQVMIGLTNTRFLNTTVDEGDGLISYQGQRFLPIYSSSTGRVQPLRASSLIGKALITEKILGNDGDIQPGDTNSFPGNQFPGYRHTSSGTTVPTDTIPMVCVGCGPVTLHYDPNNFPPTEHSAVINAKYWIDTWISANLSAAATSVLQFTFRGTVTDNVTSLPLSNAYLTVTRNGVDMGSGFTNSSGVYSFNLDFHPDSVYAVKISKGGYVSTDKTIPTTSSLVTLVGISERLNPVVGPVAPIIHALNITKSGDGMVTGPGISCSPVCKTSFKEGELVQLFAQADQGASFSGWSGCDISSVGSRCDVTISSDKVVSASFTLVTGTTPVTTTPALSITTTSLPSATVGTGYAQGVAMSGGQTPYFWSVSSGLPSGLNINSTTGAIYGYPSVSGTFSFTVTAKDSSSPQKTTSQALSLTVTSISTTICALPQVLTNGVCVTPPTTAGVPTAFTLSATTQCSASPQIVLSGWGSSGFTTFDLYRNGSLLYPANTGSTFLNTSVTAGTTYTYSVTAINASGSTPSSNTVSVTAPTCGGTVLIPTAPSGLAALPASNFMSLAWNDNSSNETGFNVERKTGISGGWSQIASVGQNIAAYRDYGVSAGVTYYYRVSAYNASGSSSYSNETSVTITVADTTLPQMAITSPVASGATVYVSSSSLGISGTASDNVGVTQVTWANDRGGSGVASGTTSWSVSGITLQSGWNTITVTARDAAGNLNLANLIVNYAVVSSTPIERITNGSFTSGTSGWTLSGDFWAGTNLTRYYTSPGYASGGVDSAGATKNYASGYMYQTVTIPSNATSATLGFWLNITSDETGSAFDNLFVEILDSSGALLTTAYTFSNVDKGSSCGTTCTFSQKIVNLISYKGRTVLIRFRATTDQFLSTVFRIDDVSLMADGN